MHFLASLDGNVEFFLVPILLSFVKGITKRSCIVRGCVQPVQGGGNDMAMLVFFQFIHGGFVNVAGMVDDIDTMLYALGNGITSSGMRTDPGLLDISDGR